LVGLCLGQEVEILIAALGKCLRRGADRGEVRGMAHLRHAGLSVIIQTIKAPNGSDRQEKFGRYLGVIWLDGVNVNDLLVSKGYVVNREY
jgi:hypothetical protein